ncbi:DUF732 domain-containing protein [Rhodococcus aerolatus]
MTRRASRPLVLAAGAVLALTAACGGSDEASSTAATTSGSTAPSSSGASSASATPTSSAPPTSGAPSSGAGAPSGSVGAATPPPAPGLTIPPGLPTTGGDGGTAPGATDPGSVPQIAEVDPAKGQSFLDALHAGGIPAGPADVFIGQYAPVICASLADGASPDEVRSQLLGVGELYRSISPLSAEQVADVMLSSAQRTYC